jgi:hypothetical protein
MMGSLVEPQRTPCLLHLLLLLLLLLAARLVHEAAAQNVNGATSVQLLPSAITLVADWFDDDPTAVCSTSNIVSASVDALLGMQQPGAPRTMVLSLALSSSQLLEATLFSTAGLQVVLFQQSGETRSESALHCAVGLMWSHYTDTVCCCRLGCRILKHWLGQVPHQQCCAEPCGAVVGHHGTAVPPVHQPRMRLACPGEQPPSS